MVLLCVKRAEGGTRALALYFLHKNWVCSFWICEVTVFTSIFHFHVNHGVEKKSPILKPKPKQYCHKPLLDKIVTHTLIYHFHK